MYLKNIELYGFKSFATRTKIDLNENITCIVGPNGSGKSNITDAIRWVLGEQSTLTLRGNKMQDVIFSGTNNKRALGMCEVIITFDNSSNMLDLDYTEISVKRKLFKNGDSEYYINNSPCRLKDIRELFMDTGIGRDGYSIIGQGRIDAILNSKPSDRRAIFEEASGISKYKSQKIDVERKLKSTNENINRLSDLLIEIENQKDNLEKESKIAEKYRDLYYKILDNEIKLMSKDLYDIKSNSLKLKNDYTELNSNKNDYVYNGEKLSTHYEALKEKIETTEYELNELQITNIENIRKEKDLINDINISKEQIKSHEKDLESIDIRLVNIDEDIKESNSQKDITYDKLKNLNSSKETIEINYNDLSTKVNTLDEKISNSLKLSESKILESKNIDETLSKNYIILNTLISLNKERKNNIDNLQNDYLRLEKNSQDIEKSLNEINKNFEENQNEINNKENILLLSKSEEENLKNEIENLENKIRNLKNEISNKSLRISTLENLEDNYEGYNKSVRDFFRFIKKNKIYLNYLHDALANLITVESKFEKAITTALGGNSQNLVVDKYKDAQEIINLLKKEKLGRITFFPLDNIKGNKRNININHRGFIDIASNLVNYDPIYKNIIENVLGNIIICDNLNSAKEIYDSGIKYSKIVTLDGDVLNPGGSVSGGFINSKVSIFSRRNEVKELKYNILENEKFLQDSIKEIESKKNLQSIKKLELENLNNELNELLNTRNNLENKIVKINYSLENNNKYVEDYENQINKLENSIKESNLNIDEINSEIEKLENDKKFILKNEDDSKSYIDKMKNELAELTKLSNEENIKLTNIITEINFTSREFSRLEDEIEKFIKTSNDLKSEKINITNEIHELKDKTDNNNKLLEEISEINNNFTNNHKSLMDTKKQLTEEFNIYSEKINKNKENIMELEKNIYYIEQKLENIFEKENEIIEYISENYKFSLIDLDIDEIDFKEIISKSKLKKLKSEINNLGEVNLGSIKAFKEVSERFNFTIEQYEDLIKTEKSLSLLIKDLEKTMVEKFNESFKKINNNFNRIFKFLFNGGSAELVIEESENINEAGIDIVAQLPGKKRQLLNAMSGGERSMTTVALLFALLETRPSPFCLLDEVDAALDEANIKRFLAYLKNLSDIQFAIITHRKSTMAAADYIYGVTMEEPGISKIISLNFDKGETNNVQMV